ncbi:MAG: M23 family metallopeptidase [Chitinophagaceae bacterium]|nr:M23 family metallopeptidase [Chitinophagaceae bacterium]
MIFLRFSLLLLLSISSFIFSVAQPFPQPNYPQNYFRNPLGVPIQLAANFGELRNNHFHMGLDIRTNQRENLPVYASAEGYISRIKIEQYGFGRAIYITHPNGYTTLYAHLNNFFPALENHLKNIQYQQEKWEQDVFLKPHLFPVSKGQFIANSGNTGGSAGPHLHFEIRETYTENNLNPFLFGLPVPDDIPPFFNRLYLYDRRQSTYNQSPVSIPVKKTGSGYTSISSVVISPSQVISFGINAGDKANASFTFGIYQAALYVDDVLQNGFQLNNFPYPDSRYINASVDYRTKAKTGTWIQHLSRLPGNQINIFSASAPDGKITLTDSAIHDVRIVLQDVSSNTSTLKFKVRYNPPGNNRVTVTSSNVLIPGKANKVAYPNVEADFLPTTFYDTVYFEHSSIPLIAALSASTIENLHNYTVPVHDSFTVRLKARDDLSPTLKGKVVMQLVSNKKKEALKGTWEGNWMEAKFRDLGSFQLIIDTVPPLLQPVGWTNGSNLRGKPGITIQAKDAVSELSFFRAELDGKWLLFSRKSDYFIHRFDDRTSPGSHTLQIVIADEAGNITKKAFTINR